MRHFPGPLQAALLTLLGGFLSAMVMLVALGAFSPTAALGVGVVVGLGSAGALGATNVPRPHAERVGLIGLPVRRWLPVLLLVPIALLASEVDNVVKAALPAPDAKEVAERALERLPTDSGLAFAETLIVVVGLVPVVEEWFFRGVLQQGLIARAGVRGGIFLSASFFALGHGSPGLSPETWVAAVAQTFVLGIVLGYARHATGSLLGSIAVHVGVNLAGVLSLAYAETVPIAGYNAPGAHSEPEILALAFIAVAAGVAMLAREAPPEIPDPPPVEEDEDEDRGFFGE